MRKSLLNHIQAVKRQTPQVNTKSHPIIIMVGNAFQHAERIRNWTNPTKWIKWALLTITICTTTHPQCICLHFWLDSFPNTMLAPPEAITYNNEKRKLNILKAIFKYGETLFRNYHIQISGLIKNLKMCDGDVQNVLSQMPTCLVLLTDIQYINVASVLETDLPVLILGL